MSNIAKYLGLNLDTKLKWKEHIKIKRDECKYKISRLRWLIGSKSRLSLDNKILLYKQLIRPMWAYGSQIWGCAAPTHINLIQKLQNITLRRMVSAMMLERNADIHRDLGMETVPQYINKLAQNYEKRLHAHPNSEALNLLDNSNEFRRLKRRKPWELANPMV